MEKLSAEDVLRNNYDGTYTLIKKDGTQSLVQKFKMNDGFTYTSPLAATDPAHKDRVDYRKNPNKQLFNSQYETGYGTPTNDKPSLAGGLKRYGKDGAGVYSNKETLSGNW